MTPEQTARAAAERDPAPRYADDRPKYHRHFADDRIHRDEDCSAHGTPRRVYVFDTEDLDQHEDFIAQRERAAAVAALADDVRKSVALAADVRAALDLVRQAVALADLGSCPHCRHAAHGTVCYTDDCGCRIDTRVHRG